MSTEKLSEAENAAIANFREYLRIPSVHPNINYDECVSFLRRQASTLGLPIQVYHVVEGKPIVVITWRGSEPALPAILLNSHMDVFPTSNLRWQREPFAAEMDEEGNIFARGTQDTKAVGIQYMEAVRWIRAAGLTLRRTVHIAFTPGESTTPLSVNIHCTSPNRKSSTEKVQIIVDHFMRFRQEQKVKLDSNPQLTPRDLTSMTLKAVKDAESELVLVFDVRVSPTEDCSTLEDLFSSWCESAGPGTYVSYEDKPTNSGLTHLDTCNPWWLTFRDECQAMNIELNPMICPGITDARHYRKVGLPALGFSPINNTPYLVHEADEFLNRKIFLDGINIYFRLISALANVPAH
uniref:N-acyl-L-amino-acid amidohydrolase n=1 Tax=Timema cristinae TaxID=61476 RepID=A0A7R9CEW4_TIMCR|nr:unnamed protein product [Timema cristinae]